MHYLRWLRHGDVRGAAPEKRHGNPSERFWAYVAKGSADECWLWLGGKANRGYGTFGVTGGQHVGAHRFAYEDLVGPIPEGLHIDHLCRVAACVNPAHMEPVTLAENNRRMRLSAEACKHGHPWTPETTIYRKNGSRVCRPCYKRDQAIQYQKRKAAGYYDR